MKIYEIEDTDFQDALIMAVYGGDKRRRYEIHFSDISYSLINAFLDKVYPYTLEDIQSDRKSHHKEVIKWMIGRGVDTAITDLLQPTSDEWTRKNEVRLGPGMGHLDLIFKGVPYELKTTRYPFNKDLPWAFSINQLANYMAAQRSELGRVKIFQLMNLAVRTWNIELTVKDIKRKRALLLRRLTLLLKALYTGNWKLLPETAYSWIIKDEDASIEFLEDNKRLIQRACKRWVKEYEARRD